MRYPKRENRTKRTEHHFPDGVFAGYTINGVLIEKKGVGGGNHEE